MRTAIRLDVAQTARIDVALELVWCVERAFTYDRALWSAAACRRSSHSSLLAAGYSLSAASQLAGAKRQHAVALQGSRILTRRL